MSVRCPQLPLLPGNSFNSRLGQTRFHRSGHFELLMGIPILTEKKRPGIGGVPLPSAKIERYPSLYPRAEVPEIPTWLVFDKQVLAFDAFFQETMQEMRGSPFTIRKVKIIFFLEDGTIQVTEPKIPNSGMAQGLLISRQRIRFPPPRDDGFYDILGFNIGKEIEFFGRVFKITNCDLFTRNFLNRCGISVPDPIGTPSDPYYDDQGKRKDGMLPKKPKSTVDTFGQFLKNDRKVLRFYGYWDDRKTEFGYLHHLEIHYYLADDTIEMKEVVPANSGMDSGFMFLSRAKLPKVYKELPTPGHGSAFTVLNVLGPGCQGGRYTLDPLNCGYSPEEYYTEKDLAIGAAMNVYGRKIVLTDCDPFTKEYYRVKYGVDDFTPAEKPKTQEDECFVKGKERELPPWNGYGTYEDSAQNCRTVEMKPPSRDFKKFLYYDKKGFDSHVLRFRAHMISKVPENCERLFVIGYYLTDDSIAVFELARRNSGFSSGKFFHRNTVNLPGEEIFTSKPPKIYTSQHMYVGAQLNINGYIFVLVDADEYALRYMELHPTEYPKANINLIMNKVRTKLQPIYKDFVAENIPNEQPVIPFETLRLKLCRIMGDDWTEHEMITLARHFSAVKKQSRFNRDRIRAIALTELKKALWNKLDRLKEAILHRDPERRGFLPRQTVYTILRACKLPVDVDLLENVLNVIEKNKDCEIDCNDLLNFLDRSKETPSDVVPLNFKYELSWCADPEPPTGALIDWCAFNKALDLEKTFAEPITDEMAKLAEEKQKLQEEEAEQKKQECKDKQPVTGEAKQERPPCIQYKK